MESTKLKVNLAFTLIELLVVIAIISLLASIVLSSLAEARSKARDSKRVQDLVQLRTALEQYALDNDGLYPDDPLGGGAGNQRVSCWQCNFPTIRDDNHFVALTPYLNPRPFDPLQPDGSLFTGADALGARGHYYKVSESRQDYKIALYYTVENLDSAPEQFRDSDFSSFDTISIYSDNAKNWPVSATCPATPSMC
jgi:prepilin-type N-terminal cleavage/methylation domain-containing protein